MMDLLHNPFFILGLSPRDNRQRIYEMADERCLVLDSNECTEARAALTNPRKRLSAEVAWLPGVGPKRAAEIIAILESSPKDLLAIDKLPPIARTNLLAAILVRLSERNANEIVKCILTISWAFEDVEPEDIRRLINDERVVSGFPEVLDLTFVESLIQERRRYFRQVIKTSLDNLPPKELVKAVTFVVESATNSGKEHGPILIADLVDSYEVKVRAFLDRKLEQIAAIIEKINKSLDMYQCPKCRHVQCDSIECNKCGIIFQKYFELYGVDSKINDNVLAPLIQEIIQIVRNWDIVARPIQVSAKGRGLVHDQSCSIAWKIRGLAVDLFNDHDMLELSQQLTSLIHEGFAEVGEVAERTAEDANALNEIAKNRSELMHKVNIQNDEWRRKITYEADVGFIFKDKLRISPDGIEWKGRNWVLDSITRIRWGGTRNFVNGVPVDTIYSIVFGNNSNYERIELRKKSIYNRFIDCLWKSVGVRLLTEYLQGLRKGNKYQFGSAIISDYGMQLTSNNSIESNGSVVFNWSQLMIWNGPGTFYISKKGNESYTAALSYLRDDNIHILENALRIFWEMSEDRISSLLDN
jgi:hypothetical protein